MESKFHVYHLRSTVEKTIEINNMTIGFKKGDVYYIGEGNNKRITHMNRSELCNKLTKELQGEISVVYSSGCKTDVVNYERKEISKYLNEGKFLANVQIIGRNELSQEDVSELKFLYELYEKSFETLKLSEGKIASYFNKTTYAIREFKKTTEYQRATPLPPKNLTVLLKELEDTQNIKLQEIKFILKMFDSGILKCTLKELCNFLGINHYNIQQAREERSMKRVDAKLLNEIISKFGFHIVSPEEKEKRNIKTVIELKKRLNINKTDEELAEILGVSSNRYTYIKNHSDYDVIQITNIEDNLLAKILSGEVASIINSLF